VDNVGTICPQVVLKGWQKLGTVAYRHPKNQSWCFTAGVNNKPLFTKTLIEGFVRAKAVAFTQASYQLTAEKCNRSRAASGKGSLHPVKRR
jgi:hypothetical protein